MGDAVRYWVPRKGMRVSCRGLSWSVCTLLRRVGRHDDRNELWEAYNPALGRRVTLAVGTFWTPWEGR